MSLRGMAIERGDFVIEVEGKFYPPFASGSLFTTINQMSAAQGVVFWLKLYGDRDTSFRLGWFIQGNQTGVGGVWAIAQVAYATTGGAAGGNFSYKLGSWATSPGAPIRMRIKRSATGVFFTVFDPTVSQFLDVFDIEGVPRLPLIASLEHNVYDGLGVACSVGVEWERMTLAPADDPLGSAHHRAGHYQTMTSNLGHVSGLSLGVDTPPTALSGVLVSMDSWVFPTKSPRS